MSKEQKNSTPPMSAEKPLNLTRRDFLRGALFIGGGLLLNRCMPTPEPTPPAPTDVPMALAPGGETTVVAIQREMNATALAETSTTPTPKPADTPTASPAATETPKPADTKPAIPPSEIPSQLDSLTSSINALPASFNPKISQEQFGQDKKGIESEIQRVKDMLAAGDVEGARKIIRRSDPITSAISGLLNSITSLGDPLQSKFVPQELKQKHDPRDKYIQKERVDPRIYDIYFQMITVLVATDPDYSGKK